MKRMKKKQKFFLPELCCIIHESYLWTSQQIILTMIRGVSCMSSWIILTARCLLSAMMWCCWTDFRKFTNCRKKECACILCDLMNIVNLSQLKISRWPNMWIVWEKNWESRNWLRGRRQNDNNGRIPEGGVTVRKNVWPEYLWAIWKYRQKIDC